MASSGLGDFPLLSSLVTVEGLIEPVQFGNKTTAASSVVRDYFFGTVGGGFSLTADVGVYALSGIAAGLQATRTLGASQGSYALTGQDIALIRGRTLAADQGSYTLNGQAAALLYAHVSGAGQGSYALSGQTANLLYARRLAADQGSYSLSGQDATLTHQSGGNRELVADVGLFTLSGQTATLLVSRRLSVDHGSYSLSGQAALLGLARVLSANTGNYSILGQSVSFGEDESAGDGVSSFYIIKVFDMITTSSDSFSRPANTTQYASGDLIANSATAENVEPLIFTTTALGSGRGIVRRARLYKNAATTTAATFTIHLFSLSPTVANGDNGAFAVNSARYYLGGIAVDMSSGAFVVSGTDIIKNASISPEINFDLGSISSSERRLYGLIEATAGYSPASGELFEVTLEIVGTD